MKLNTKKLFFNMLRSLKSADDCINALIKNGAKNLVPFPYTVGDYTSNGITFTSNGDGTYTVNGTATAQADIWLTRVHLADGDYRITGSSDNTQVILHFYLGTDWVKQVRAYSNIDELFTISDDGTYDRMLIEIRVASGTVVDDEYVAPMICPVAYNRTWEPYGMTNIELSKRATVRTYDISDMLTVSSAVSTVNTAVMHVYGGRIVALSLNLTTATNQTADTFTDLVTLPNELRPITLSPLASSYGAGQITQAGVASFRPQLALNAGRRYFTSVYMLASEYFG